VNSSAGVFGLAAWWLALVVTTAVAVVLDVRLDEGAARSRMRRSLALLLFGGVALWAVLLAWNPEPSGLERTLQAVAWWLPVVPVLWLGTVTAQPGGARAISRLAAVQAVPAILLSFAPALGLRAVGALAAGAARIAVPPLHPMNLAAAESLPPGSLGLLLVFGLTVGGPVAVRGITAIPLTATAWILLVLALIAGAVGAAALRDPHLLRRIAVWSAVQGTVALVVAELPAVATGRAPAALATAHLGASAAVLPALVFSLGRVVSFFRVPDLRAHGGLGREAPQRARLMMATVLLAVVCSSTGPAALVTALAAEPSLLSRATYVTALVGWFGANLSIVLGAYRVVRGERPSPGEPAPELLRAEAVLLIVLLAFSLVARALPDLWEVPMAPLPSPQLLQLPPVDGIAGWAV
jgi:hypothetical protein